jgi:ATP phosphoribosyltransferase
LEALTIALPKGRLQEQAMSLFAAIGHDVAEKAALSRKLILPDVTGALRYVLAKPSDVPVYVEHGAADLGIVGLDVLREHERGLYEPLALNIGRCRLVLAGPTSARKRNLRLATGLRVASKYPHLAQRHLQRLGVTAEIIPLDGSVELAPAVGLADLLVDLVETGRTLHENGLVELETILEVQAMLVVNRASYNLHLAPIQDLIRRLAAEVARRANAPQEPSR